MHTPDRQYVVSIDLGATNMLAGVVDEGGSLIHREHVPTEAERGFDAVVETMIELIAKACSKVDITPDRVASLGVAVAGAVEFPTGIVIDAFNLKWRDKPLRRILESRLDRPVVIENDVNAATWGEYNSGAGDTTGDCFGVWVGTGIGGGLVLDGQLYRGDLSTAGEFGLTVSMPDGEEGFRTVEDFAGRVGLRRQLVKYAAMHPESMLHAQAVDDPDGIGTAELAEAYQRSDALARMVIDRGADLLGTALANLVTILSVGTVIIGGGLTEAFGDPFINRIRSRFDRDVFPARCQACRIVRTRLESDAGLLGAALLARETIDRGT